MTNDLTLDVRLSRTAIASAQQPQLVYVLLSIQPAAKLATVRLPVNLNLVVDRSQSMCIPILTEEQFEELARRGGAREVVVDGVPVWEFRNAPAELAVKAPRNLDFVKAALRHVVERLGPADRFSLVVFAREGRVAIGNESAANRRRLLAAVDQLDGLQLGDETHMARGVALGYAEATRHMSPETVTRIVQRPARPGREHPASFAGGCVRQVDRLERRGDVGREGNKKRQQWLFLLAVHTLAQRTE